MSRALGPPAQAADPTRGLARVPDPRVWGTLVGAAGGTVFVLANRGDLPGPLPGIAVAAWALTVAAYVWFVLVVPRPFGPVPQVRRSAGLVYLTGVVGMLVLIRVGSLLLEDADRTELRPALIVVAVGLHFLPFASAFHTPLFTVLGLLMPAIGGVGLVLGWAWDGDAGAWAAVIAGLTMLTLIASDAAPTRTGADA
ncbi:hypothetical protein JK386_04255 [Nocardioides sp. zg-536]|uniref:Uncharacterized protein n=1 Tax=Nocardioides faecalis TaxID=2803858 RepID=A0A939BX86_9ACTN|nr:hypothetical protein [Nocardioides faecalis]MBM9459103.1 hypothetical protein [Nocardioides faecalis]QVI57361.1 hypothetical protein KG111_09515 [Nocardioides faecalis]